MMEDFVKELVTAENDKYNAQQQQFGDALIAFIRHNLKYQNQFESQQLHVASEICYKCSVSTRVD